jgi:hypothetical protein
MREWLPYLALYVLGLALFRLLGGLGAAGSAFRRWGRGSSGFRTSPGSSS